jgi:hypothetical protein
MERKKVIALLTAMGMLFMMSSCGKTKKDYSDGNIPIRETLTEVHKEIDSENPIKNYYKSVMENGEAVIKYKAENIQFLVNKKTYETMMVIKCKFSSIQNDDFKYKVYILEDKSLELLAVVQTHIFKDDTGNNADYWDYLNSVSYCKSLKDIKKYIGSDFKVKDYYTYEELVDLMEKTVYGIKATREEERKVNVK